MSIYRYFYSVVVRLDGHLCKKTGVESAPTKEEAMQKVSEKYNVPNRIVEEDYIKGPQEEGIKLISKLYNPIVDAEENG